MSRDSLPEGWGVVGGEDSEDDEKKPYQMYDKVTYNGANWEVRSCERVQTLGEALQGGEAKWRLHLKNLETEVVIEGIDADDVTPALGIFG